MASKEPSIVIKAPPTAVGATGGSEDDRESSDPDLGDGGLLSSTPSSIPNQGPHFAPLENLMTIIDTLRRENSELRNHLSDQNLLIEHKSKNLEQINDNYRQYDEMVKQKHKETAEKFRAMKEEYEKLKEELEQVRADNGKSEKLEAGQQKTAGHEVGEKELGSWTAVEMKQGLHTDDEYEAVKLELTEEKQKTYNLSESLRKERTIKEATQAKLNTAFNDLAKIRDERKKDNQELRKSLTAELNSYKQQVQSLLTDLTESKRNLALHSKKVQELHEANLQFDQVNSAYHEKLALYEEELKKRDKTFEQLKQEYYTCNQQLKQTMQRLQTEKHDKQVFEDEVMKLQDSIRQYEERMRGKQREVDNLTARIVSMDESLAVRDRKLKDSQVNDSMLKEQLKQYAEDFEHERLARERTHQEARQNQEEVEALRRRNKELQDAVDRYTQSSVLDLSRQYSNHPAQPLAPEPPEGPVFQARTPPHVPYGGDLRGFDWDEQHRQGTWRPPPQDEEQGQHPCPMCEQVFAESGSLQIHVQTHFD